VTAVWLATPDGEPSAQAVDFTSEGDAIRFIVPTLDAWTMIVVEYEQ
jgi:hypothetical protein